MRRAAKVDANATSIVDALRAIGCSVDILPGGNGRPDLLVGVDGANRKYNVLMEAKDGDGKLNALQKKWHANWKGTAHVVWTIEQALMVVAFYKTL